VTEARFIALTAARRTPGGKRNVKQASATKRAGAVAWLMPRVIVAIALGKRT
jgi:hypothetical protein